MTSSAPRDSGYRFPPEIISHAVWLYHRFGLSFRGVEDLLAERGITISYEAIRPWCQTFGSDYARTLRCRRGRMGDIWHLDELFVTIQGRRQYLWRAVDQDGDVTDILVQPRRNRHAAARFFRTLLKGQGHPPATWSRTSSAVTPRGKPHPILLDRLLDWGCCCDGVFQEGNEGGRDTMTAYECRLRGFVTGLSLQDSWRRPYASVEGDAGVV